MQEPRAQIILLVRAFEEADPEGLVLPQRERARANRRALMVTGLSGEQGESTAAWRIRSGEAVLRRARLLFDSLVRSHPAIPRILRLAQLGASTAPALIGLALLAGLSTNLLGMRREINLLSVPLLGLLAWNLGLYAVLLGMRLSGRRPTDGCAHFLCEKLFRGALWRRLHSSRLIERGGSTEARIIAKAITRFGALWHRLAGPLLAARVRRMLHLGAMALLVGALAGMYLRGVAFEYRATWESTWFGAAQVQVLLGVVLGPAAALSGVTLPDVAPLRGPEGSGPAALWIHLYAISAVLYVIVPRTGLALLESWRCHRLARHLPLDLDDAYFRRMFAAWRGSLRRVLIAPYSYAPPTGTVATLKTLLFDFFGARADVRLRDVLPYGAEAESVVPDAVAEDEAEHHELCLVVVFNSAQTPESEVHGRLLEELKAGLDRQHDRLLVVLDTTGYRSRVTDAERLREREEAWARVVREVGLTTVPLHVGRAAGAARYAPEEGLGQDLIGAVRGALWPTTEETVAT